MHVVLPGDARALDRRGGDGEVAAERIQITIHLEEGDACYTLSHLYLHLPCPRSFVIFDIRVISKIRRIHAYAIGVARPALWPSCRGALSEHTQSTIILAMPLRLRHEHRDTKRSA